MNALQIKLTGKITDTNFEEWKTDLLAQIASSKRELQTDEDFAIAEADVKNFKAGEKTLKTAKQSALEQAAAIQKLFAAIDEVTEEARQARLALERQIKTRKEEIRNEIVDDGMRVIEAYLGEQGDTFHAVNRKQFMDHNTLGDYTKGKRSGSSMQKAIAEAVTAVKEQINAKSESIAENEKIIDGTDKKYAALFQDRATLIAMDANELAGTIKKRIDFFEQEQARLDTEKSDAGEKNENKTAEAAATTSDTVTDEEQLEDENTDLEKRHKISIEIFADTSRADEFLDELEGRYGHRDMIGEIRLEK